MATVLNATIPAEARRQMRAAESAERAIEKARRLHPSVVSLGTNDGVPVYKVQGSHPMTWYLVVGNECTCAAADRGLVCYHRAAVLLHRIAADAGDAFNAALDASIASRPMQPLCKACERRPAGARGLCWVCEERQRTAQPATQWAAGQWDEYQEKRYQGWYD